MTSHQTVDVVLAHYFKPGRDDFRRALAEKMPKVFSLEKTEAPVSNVDELLKSSCSELEAMTAENWRDVRDRLLRRLNPAS